MNFKGVIILVLAVLCLVVFFQNTEVVTFRLFFWDLNMSRIVMLLFTLVVGIIIGYILTTVLRGKTSRE